MLKERLLNFFERDTFKCLYCKFVVICRRVCCNKK